MKPERAFRHRFQRTNPHLQRSFIQPCRAGAYGIADAAEHNLTIALVAIHPAGDGIRFIPLRPGHGAFIHAKGKENLIKIARFIALEIGGGDGQDAGREMNQVQRAAALNVDHALLQPLFHAAADANRHHIQRIGLLQQFRRNGRRFLHRFFLKRLGKMPPNAIQHSLFIERGVCHHQHGVVLLKDDAKLRK